MATTTAPFTPALATGGSNSTALATTGGTGSNAGGALATFTPGMDVQQANGNAYPGGAGGGGPLASVQQMLQQPSIKKSHAPHLDGHGCFVVCIDVCVDQHAHLPSPHD